MQVLIGRGLDHKLCVKRKHCIQETLFNFEDPDGFSASLEIPNRTSEKTRLCLAGVNGDEVTPVPIPNTEVKLISVENTWLETAWEDRAVPAQNGSCQ